MDLAPMIAATHPTAEGLTPSVMPMRFRRPLVRLMMLPLLATLSLACSGEARRVADAAGGGTLVVVVPAEPATLLPPMVTSTQGGDIVGVLFERLAEIGARLETYGDRDFEPRLAASWSWRTDSLSIAFAIDPKARWHDGRPVRARDVQFSFDVYTSDSLATEHQALLSNIDSVSVPDSLTAVFWFKRRTPQQFYDATHHMHVLPSHLLDTIPLSLLADASFGRAPIGSGAFRFTRWTPGQRIELEANPAHPRGRPSLDRVIWSITPDPGAATVALFAGEADFYEMIRPENLPQVARTPTLRLVDNQSLQYGFLGFNVQDPKRPGQPHPVLGDVAVRRALSLAVDRTTLARNVFDSLGLVGLGPAPRALIPDTTAFQQIPYDPATARALLDSAGWRDADGDGARERDGIPLAFEILVPNSSQTRQRYAVLLQAQYRAIGVKATPRVLDVNALITRIDAHDFDAYTGSWQTSPGLVGLRQTWSSTGTGNAGRYASTAFDAAVDSALSTFDALAARSHWARAFQQIIDDAPAVWLYEQRMPVAVHRRFQVPPLHPTGWYRDLAAWRIDPSQRIDRDRLPAPLPRADTAR